MLRGAKATCDRCHPLPTGWLWFVPEGSEEQPHAELCPLITRAMVARITTPKAGCRIRDAVNGLKQGNHPKISARVPIDFTRRTSWENKQKAIKKSKLTYLGWTHRRAGKDTTLCLETLCNSLSVLHLFKSRTAEVSSVGQYSGKRATGKRVLNTEGCLCKHNVYFAFMLCFRAPAYFCTVQEEFAVFIQLCPFLWVLLGLHFPSSLRKLRICQGELGEDAEHCTDTTSEINFSLPHNWSCSGLSHLNCLETRQGFSPKPDWIPLYLLFLEPTHVFLHIEITPLWVSSVSSQCNWRKPLSSESH